MTLRPLKLQGMSGHFGLAAAVTFSSVTHSEKQGNLLGKAVEMVLQRPSSFLTSLGRMLAAEHQDVRQSRASRETCCCPSLSRLVVARPSIILAITVILVSPSAMPVALAQGRPKDSGPCSKTYTDDEAKQLTDAARKVVRRGHPRRRGIVLKDLGVDPSRLCNRRQGGANLGYRICWQVSPSYDLTWWLSAFDGPPDDRDDRRISAVRIVQRRSGYWGTQCPMTDEERGPPKKTAAK
jgi:hypothetical protein